MKNLTKPIGKNQSLMKILIRMKLTFLFLLTGLIAVSASTYSQNTRINVEVKNNTLNVYLEGAKITADRIIPKFHKSLGRSYTTVPSTGLAPSPSIL